MHLSVSVRDSESALHAQLGFGGAFDLLVDESDLLLGQSSLHVAVDDAVALTPPTGPETQRKREIVTFNC